MSPADTVTLRAKQGSQSKRDTETVRMEEVASGWGSKGVCGQRKELEAAIQETAEGCQTIRQAGAKACGRKEEGMTNTNTSTTRTNSLGKMRPGREEGLGKRPRATRDMNARPGLGEICPAVSQQLLA